MSKVYKTAIIGGGAGGLLSAVELVSGKNAFCGQDVIVLERNDRVGKKLIATGNGQANLTNLSITKENYHGDGDFITAFLGNLKKVDLNNYFERLGIFLTADEVGRVYPISKQASSVLDAIRSYLSYKGVKEQVSTKVEKIQKNKDVFEIFTSNGKFLAQNVIFSTGGCAQKQFGTDGSCYALVSGFKHKCTPLYPSLVQLKTDMNKIRALKGLKEYAKVTAHANGKAIKSAVGDVLFTQFGVSGNAIFQVSSGIADKKDAYLIIEFLPRLGVEELTKILDSKRAMPHVEQVDLLSGILNKRVGQAVLKSAKSNSVKDVVHQIKNFRLDVIGSLDFNSAQVTRGGIKTDQIDKNTYQSKLVKGLYFVGEVIDIDGDCGGYNLTFAFVSGILSAKSIKGEI